MREYYRVSPIGRLEGIVERFYAISVGRKLKHPAVLAISETARTELSPGSASAAPSR